MIGIKLSIKNKFGIVALAVSVDMVGQNLLDYTH